MAGRYLLNPDGSYPNGMTPERCAALGLTPVLPSPVPVQPGYVAVEGEPVQDGPIWRQVWELEPVPNAPPEDEPLPDLDRPQFAYLLALGLGDVWDAVEARARAVDREIYAELRAARERTLFRYDLTMAMIERLAPIIPEGVDLSREAVAAVWRKAAERGGVLSVEAGG